MRGVMIRRQDSAALEGFALISGMVLTSLCSAEQLSDLTQESMITNSSRTLSPRVMSQIGEVEDKSQAKSHLVAGNRWLLTSPKVTLPSQPNLPGHLQLPLLFTPPAVTLPPPQ
jgi:hypothetical protein